MLERKKPLELKKHVATIHSSNRLSLLQRKISNALLFNAYERLLTQDEHHISIAGLCRLIGYNSHDHRMIKKALVELLSTVLEWNLVDGERLDQKEAGVWNASAIIADASIEGSLCTYSYSNKMRKLLYHPELYGRLNLSIQAKFQSSYGLALYENCIRYQDIGQTPWFDLLKFRKLMGVEEGKYKVFRDFKTRVLDKAVQEVNGYSPIVVDLQLRKQSRKVLAIQFLIKKNKLAVGSEEDKGGETETLSDHLKERFGFSKKHCEAALSQYEEHYIREKIAWMENSPFFQQGKVKNVARFLWCALKEDYRETVSSQECFQEGKKSDWQEAFKQKEERALQQKREQDDQRDYTTRLDRAIEALPEGEKALFLEKFRQEQGAAIQMIMTLQRGKYTQETVLQSPSIKALLRQFAEKTLSLNLCKAVVEGPIK